MIKKKKIKKQTTVNGLNALVWKENNLYVAKTIEVEIASQGPTSKQALKNLQEALELYFENEKIPSNKISPLQTLRLKRLFPKIQYA